MKKYFFTIIIIVIISVLTASLYNLLENNLLNYSKRPIKMAVTFYNYNSSYARELKDELINVVTDNEDLMVASSAANNPSKLEEQLINLKDKNYDFIFLSGSSNLSDFAVEEFKEQGSKLIGINDYCSFCQVSVYIDNFKAGKLEALEMTRNLSSAKLVILSDNSYESDERVAGIESLLTSYPEFEVLRVIDNIEELKYLHNFDVILATTDNLAIQVLDYGNGNIKIYSIGGSPEIKKLISNGYIQASIALKPIELANKAIDFAYQMVEGKKVSDLEIGLDTYSIDNINNKDISGWK